jgi:hypothetical protein
MLLKIHSHLAAASSQPVTAVSTAIDIDAGAGLSLRDAGAHPSVEDVIHGAHQLACFFAGARRAPAGPCRLAPAI